MGGGRWLTAVGISWLLVFGLTASGRAQVVAEPAMLRAGVAETEEITLNIAFPEDGFVLGGIMRFPVAADVDIGGRAGIWFAGDGGDDNPYLGGDIRYGLLSRPLAPSGGELNLSFAVGIGASDPGPTIWRIPVGFITGLGFGAEGDKIEVFVHPRLEFGFSTDDANGTDTALQLDVGGYLSIVPPLGAMIDIRFGDGIFGDTDRPLVALAAIWGL